METLQSNKNDTISLYDLLLKVRRWFSFLASRWLLLLIVSSFGGAIGIGYAHFSPITYTARLNFFVEEGKTGGSGLASLAGQFGFDLGGLGGGNGLLSGDNIFVFLKSASLARETLLTPYDPSGTVSLADRYAATYNLREKWRKNSKIGKEVFFPVGGQQVFTRLQDSLLQTIVDGILQEDISIEKPDKKASFVQVSVEMKDELLAKYYCERLVNKATDRYVTTKTNRQLMNVNRLQRRADSISVLLNRKTFATAISQEQLLDVNPAFKSATVSAEVTGRDKIMLTTIYGEIIKNLEISKVALSQETPTIQIVDDVVLPLKVNQLKALPAFLLGALLATIVCVILLTMKLIVRSIAPPDKI